MKKKLKLYIIYYVYDNIISKYLIYKILYFLFFLYIILLLLKKNYKIQNIKKKKKKKTFPLEDMKMPLKKMNNIKLELIV